MCIYISKKMSHACFSLASQDPHHLSIPAFQALLNLRKNACDQLYNKHLRGAAAIAGDNAPRHRNPREEDMYVAGRVVQMQCPEVTLADETLPAMVINSLWSVRDPVLWIELKAENLEYVALFLRKGLAEEQVSRRRKSLRGDLEDDREAIQPKASPKKRKRSHRRRRARADDSEDGREAAAPLNAADREPEQEDTDAEANPEAILDR